MPHTIAGSSPKAAVAVDFAEVGKDALDVVERIRTVGMTRQFGALPRRQLAGHLAAQRFHAVVQHLQLLLRLLIARRRRSAVARSAFRSFPARLALWKQLPYWDRFLGAVHGLAAYSQKSSAEAIQFASREFRSSAMIFREFIAATGTASRNAMKAEVISTAHVCINDAHAAAPAQLFHTIDERAVRQHIIAFRLHHHGEVALAFQVEEHVGLAPALAGRWRAAASIVVGDAFSSGTLMRRWLGSLGLRLFQRRDVVRP